MKNSSRISNQAVLKATGKDWKQWFAILDKAGAKTMKHSNIARFVYDNYLGKSGWWSQMVTVEYERERGLRQVNQQLDGFLVAVHKTVPRPVAWLQKKWDEIVKSPEVAKKNLVRIPSKTKRAMLRYKADVGRIVVSFDARGKDKARIMVETIRLSNKSAVEPTRAFWKKILSQLE